MSSEERPAYCLADLAVGALLLVVAVAGLIAAQDFPPEAARFPVLVLGAMGTASSAFLAVSVVQTWRKRSHGPPENRTDRRHGGQPDRTGHEKSPPAAAGQREDTARAGSWELGPGGRGLVVVASAMLLTIGLGHAGFIVSTLILLLVLPLVLGYRRLLVLVPFAGVLVAALHYLFFTYLHLSDLPWALW